MTKTKLREEIKKRWDGRSAVALTFGEDWSVIMVGMRHIHTTLYTPHYRSIRDAHNKRVHNYNKFEPWVRQICEEEGIPYRDWTQYHGTKPRPEAY